MILVEVVELLKRLVYWILVLVWCGMIYHVTSSPAATSSNTSSIIKKETKASPKSVHKMDFILRKSAHVTLFGVLALLLLFALGSQKGAPLLAWFLASLYGATDEIHQIYVPDRTPSITDVGIDSIGALIALLLFLRVRKLVMNR